MEINARLLAHGELNLCWATLCDHSSRPAGDLSKIHGRVIFFLESPTLAMAYAVLLLGILKKGPDRARTFKKRANQNISGPHTYLMQNTLSISICALPFYKKLL